MTSAGPERPAWAWSATELLRELRCGALSAVDVVEAVLDRISSRDPAVGAFTEVDYEGSRAGALTADTAYRNGTGGPACGIPVSVKDLHPVRGMRTSYGEATRPYDLDTEDDAAVARLRAAGAVIIGKTRCPEQGYSYSSVSSDGGAVLNPWRLDFGAGGSSSGAAAAVATGMGPIALGSDGAGSVRMPASLCGVVGFKPSFGRIPVYPSADAFTFCRAHIGPLTRTVADAAFFTSVTQGQDGRDPLSWSDAERLWPLPDLAIEESARLRVAWCAEFSGTVVAEEVSHVTAAAARDLAAALGCSLAERSPDWDDAPSIQRVLWDASYAMRFPEDSTLPGITPDALIRMVKRGRAISLDDYGAAARARTNLVHRIDHFFREFDLLITPTCTEPGWPVHAPIGLGKADDDPLRVGRFLYPFNLTGYPCISLPAGFTSTGVPVGVQVAAGWRRDRLALQVAAAFERARPWRDTWPPDVS